jgi:aspartyl-tRNA(Asn)/glutamyl-tRNA(Gln) amidotransferase subunit C
VDSPAVDRPLVLHIAKLASLSLSGDGTSPASPERGRDDDEADRLAKDLAQIIGYVEQLSAVDTSDVVAAVPTQADRIPWRLDEARPGLSHDDALAQAPQVESGGFAVPTFVE